MERDIKQKEQKQRERIPKMRFSNHKRSFTRNNSSVRNRNREREFPKYMYQIHVFDETHNR